MEFSAATVLTATDWRQWVGRNIDIRDGGLELASEPSLTVDQLSVTAIDIAVDADGTYYTLQSSGAVYRHDRQRGIETRLGEVDGLADPVALCVSGDRLYLVDETGSVAVISHRLQQPIGTIETGIEKPVTITAADGRLFLLDSGAGAVRTVQPDGTTETVFGSFSRPVDMTVDEGGEIYVLEEQADRRTVQKQTSSGDVLDGRIHLGRSRRLRKQSPDGDSDPDQFPLSMFETVDGVSVTPTRIATAAGAPLLLMGAVSATDETVVADVDPETSRLRERHRLDGSCRVFRTPAAGTQSSYAVTDNARCLELDPTDTHARGPTDEFHGSAYRQFDAGQQAVQWHRLAVDRDGPPASTRLQLSYFASDDPSPLEQPLSSVTDIDASVLAANGIETVWDLLSYEPSGLAGLTDEMTVGDARASLDTALAALAAATEGQWQTAESTADILLSEATGRYLTVRLELIGSRTASPRVDSLRAFWPRQSYLDSLPELYRDEAASAAFLEQLLSVFGTFFTDFERDVETVTQYFDPAAVPADALPWLADWIGADAPVDWPTAATRQLLVSAPELYTKRGTKDGLRDLLLLYLSHLEPPEQPPTDRLVATETASTGIDVDTTAVEHGLWILEPGALEAGSAAATGAYRSHCSGHRSVVVYAGPFADADQREAVETIVDRETPAHVEGSLVELEPELTLGATSFLGVNSRLAERQLELGAATLGNTAVLK